MIQFFHKSTRYENLSNNDWTSLDHFVAPVFSHFMITFDVVSVPQDAPSPSGLGVHGIVVGLVLFSVVGHLFFEACRARKPVRGHFGP